MMIHLLSLSADFHHTTIISVIQFVQLRHKFISLTHQSIYNNLDITHLGIILRALSLQNVNLLIKFLNTVMRLKLLGLQLPDKIDLFLVI